MTKAITFPTLTKQLKAIRESNGYVLMMLRWRSPRLLLWRKATCTSSGGFKREKKARMMWDKRLVEEQVKEKNRLLDGI